MKECPIIEERTVVIFAGSEYTIVKKLNNKKVNIKQNFSLGLVYENIDVKDLKILK